MPQIYDVGRTALLPLRRKACWGFFRPLKIRRLRPGLNPRTWVLKASTLPLDHRSRYDMVWCDMMIWYIIWNDIWYDIFVNCNWCSTVHIYTQTVHGTGQNLGRVRAVSRFCERAPSSRCWHQYTQLRHWIYLHLIEKLLCVWGEKLALVRGVSCKNPAIYKHLYFH